MPGARHVSGRKPTCRYLFPWMACHERNPANFPRGNLEQADRIKSWNKLAASGLFGKTKGFAT
jgi:hypothetical protein